MDETHTFSDNSGNIYTPYSPAEAYAYQSKTNSNYRIDRRRPGAPISKVIVWALESRLNEMICTVVTVCRAKALSVNNLAELDTIKKTELIGLAIVSLQSKAGLDIRSLETIRQTNKQGFAVVAHGQGLSAWSLENRCQTLNAGASYLLDDDCTDFPAQLETVVRRLLKKSAAQQGDEQQIHKLMGSLGVVGQSRQMTNVFRQIIRIAPLSDLPVLITGESGTGKELAARAIHSLDPKRSNGPFVALNSGAISTGIAESELFGHKKGAFTGANQERKGLFRAAEDGILFLDEIGELEADLQVKLLRVLQESRVLGVGHDLEIAVNSRIIAATHRDFQQMLDNHKFRLDLYHRLNVLSLHIPPLRERPDDIKPLVEHFMIKNRSLINMDLPSVGQEFFDAIRSLPLYGNARELENIVRCVLLGKQDELPFGLSDLPAEVWRQLCHSQSQFECGLASNVIEAEVMPEHTFPDCGNWPESLMSNEAADWELERLMDDFERQIIQAVMQKSQGNQTRAAQMLGVTPRSVYNKLKKYQLN